MIRVNTVLKFLLSQSELRINTEVMKMMNTWKRSTWSVPDNMRNTIMGMTNLLKNHSTMISKESAG